MDSKQPPFPIVNGQYKMPAEPVVRIGIVLAQDAKHEMQFSVPGDGYRISAGSKSAALEKGVVHTISSHGDALSIDHATLPGQHASLRLSPPAGTKAAKAGDGTHVRKIVAGRGFHWQKNIDQTLTDVLEFFSRNGAIVMVNEIPIETYLTGVITGEMSGECPIEFMKAQAIAARSWLLGQPVAPHPSQPYLWCNDDCCQRYQGTGGWSQRAIDAIAQCRGEVLITETNKYCDARYSKSTGTVSEDAEHVWGIAIEGLVARLDAPKGSVAEKFFPVTEANLRDYILGDWTRNNDVYCSPTVVPEETITKYLGRVDETGQYFRWEKKLSQADLRESLTTRGGLTDLATVKSLNPIARGRSGRIRELDVVYANQKGETRTHRINSEYKIRAALSTKFLFSSCFIVSPDLAADGALKGVTLNGAGWGHGAGLCQIGGLGRALKGQRYDEILLHYYSNVRLERIYS
ncbi:SpoIID/LytB domain-containing protein [Candidatus Sumerlaeota bacterium]|nr:SpoIID/LytB domain-containing protein [Candidatus Sumerlaeota bacterium]